MADITAKMVKALRDETAQGMMDCKKALTEADGDMEAARDILRKKGMDTAGKKAARTTAEGIVAIKLADDGSSAAIVEVLCETDFCARNDVFQNMVRGIADLAYQCDDGPIEATAAIAEAVQSALAQTGENMSFSRGLKISASRVGTYVHHNNKVGVLVGIEGEIDDETLAGVCMHVAFADPMGIGPDDIPQDLVEKERQFARQQAIESGKPPEIADKIVIGKMNKFLSANALLEQPFVRDDKKKVKDVLGSATVTAFARYAIGG